jgi:hypothetical protein
MNDSLRKLHLQVYTPPRTMGRRFCGVTLWNLDLAMSNHLDGPLTQPQFT